MKQTINFSQFCDAFHSYDRNEQFSYEAKRLIFDYLEQYEEDTGEQIELDIIAICCDYSEESAEDTANNYSIDLSDLDADSDNYDDELAALVIKYLVENTQYIGKTLSGLVYQQF